MEAIYARQSLDIKDSLSIETQIDFCKKHCIEDTEPLIYKDKGFSGKNTKRPAFQRMLSDIKDGKISKVIIYKLDRLSRSIIDFSEIWRIFEQEKVNLFSATQNFDTSTPMGKAMLFIVMVFAEMERETIAERVKDNYYSRVKDGRWPGGPAPYGLTIGRLIDSQGRRVPTLVQNENMEIMKSIYEQYAYTEISLGKQAMDLNKKGIPCMRSKTWSSVSLAKLMRNPVYVQADYEVYCYIKSFGIQIINPVDDFTGERAGILVGKRGTLAGGTNREYKEYSDMVFILANWKGAVTSEMWLAANYKLDTNKQIGNNGKGSITWLTGLMKCGECKYAIKLGTEKIREKRTLHCSGKYNRQNECTNKIGFHLGEIETYVEKELEEVINSCQGEELEIQSELSNEDKIALEKTEKAIENLIATIGSGEADSTLLVYINNEVKRLDEQKKEILKKLSVEKKPKVVIQKIDFSKLNLEEKHLVAASYINRVFIRRNEIEIEWKV